jgi:hypothetical protein
MQTRPEYANRISYVIAPDGSIIYHYQTNEYTCGSARLIVARGRFGGTCVLYRRTGRDANVRAKDGLHSMEGAHS